MLVEVVMLVVMLGVVVKAIQLMLVVISPRVVLVWVVLVGRGVKNFP